MRDTLLRLAAAAFRPPSDAERMSNFPNGRNGRNVVGESRLGTRIATSGPCVTPLPGVAMLQRSMPVPMLALSLALSAVSALAQQQPEEQDRALVHRHAPAQATFSEAIARRLRVDD